MSALEELRKVALFVEQRQDTVDICELVSEESCYASGCNCKECATKLLLEIADRIEDEHEHNNSRQRFDDKHWRRW